MLMEVVRGRDFERQRCVETWRGRVPTSNDWVSHLRGLFIICHQHATLHTQTSIHTHVYMLTTMARDQDGSASIDTAKPLKNFMLEPIYRFFIGRTRHAPLLSLISVRINCDNEEEVSPAQPQKAWSCLLYCRSRFSVLLWCLHDEEQSWCFQICIKKEFISLSGEEGRVNMN